MKPELIMQFSAKTSGMFTLQDSITIQSVIKKTLTGGFVNGLAIMLFAIFICCINVEAKCAVRPGMRNNANFVLEDSVDNAEIEIVNAEDENTEIEIHSTESNTDVTGPDETKPNEKKGNVAKRHKKSNASSDKVAETESESQKSESSLTEEQKTFLIWFGIIAAIIYVIAQILNHTTSCVILYKWYDFALMVLFYIIVIVTLFISPLLEEFKELRESGETLKLIGLIILVYGIPLIVSIILSITSNLGNGFLSVIYITISILTKVVVLILVPLFMIGYLMAKEAGSEVPKDGRFKDGTRGNGKTAAVVKAMAILSFFFTVLVATLMKDDD